MNILHVGYVENRPDSGVANVIPLYLSHQSRYAKVALLNYCDFIPVSAENTYPVVYAKDGQYDLSKVKLPFSKIDLVVFHEVYRPQFIKLSAYLRKNNIPYIITPHGSLTKDALRHKMVKKYLGNLFFFSLFIKNARAIHFLSESERDKTVKFNKTNSFIRNNGVKLLSYQKKGFSKDRLDLVYVGRLEVRIKGIDRILDTAKIIKERMIQDNIRIQLFGTGNQKDIQKIQKLIVEQKLSEVVVLNDGVFGDEKIQKILSHDCFIQLSRTEGQPLGIIEAMGIGMPCLVTEGTTFHKTAKELGIAIPVPDDPEEIAAIILNIRSGVYNLHDISSQASEYVKNNFDWHKVARLMVQDYQNLLLAGKDIISPETEATNVRY